MKKLSGCLLIFAVVLSGCGGGAPYVGLWQCASDPNRSLEIRQFEEYFIVTASEGSKQIKRQGTFENEMLSIGANNVGAQMALELNGEEITCTKPPNFCHCDGTYKKVDALMPVDNTSQQQVDKPIVEPPAVEQSPLTHERKILEGDPTILNLNNGGIVRVFNDAENEINEKRASDWPKLTYYYIPELALTKLANENFAEVKQIDDEVAVIFNIKPRNIDSFELIENVHKAVNTKIRTDHVLPLFYESLTLALPGSTSTTSVVVSNTEFDLTSDAIDISLTVKSDPNDDVAAQLKSANEIASAINNGSMLPIATIRFVQQFSAQNMIDAASNPLAVNHKTTEIELPIAHE
ncbi:MAG: hypothetical protein O3C28_12200 [Proteobacteria bacterium]|nr:hypothetical protein [Pseudomonadota bacterium]